MVEDRFDSIHWMAKTLKIPADTVAKDKSLSRNFDAQAQSMALKLHEMGFKCSRIAVLLPKAVDPADVAKLFGVNHNHESDRAPVCNVAEGEWLSAEQLTFLVDNVAVDRLAHCFRGIGQKGSFVLLWKHFVEEVSEKVKNGEALPENPTRMSKKQVKRDNADLRKGKNPKDVKKAMEKHNARVHEKHRVERTEPARAERTKRRWEQHEAASEEFRKSRSERKRLHLLPMS